MAASWTEEEQAALRDLWDISQRFDEEVNAEVTARALRIPAFAAILARMPPQVIEEQRVKSREHIRKAMLEGDWTPYLADLADQGARYAHLGVDFHLWFDIVTAYRHVLAKHLEAAHGGDVPRLVRTFEALDRYMDIAMGTIGTAYLAAKEQIIADQQDAIRELSTPVLQVQDGLLILALVGVLDTARTRQLTENLLLAIRAKRARVVVMDITGVPIVDSKVANHLVQTVKAARLMGADVIVTGISPEIAQTLVQIGAELRGAQTLGDLQWGLEEANRILRAERAA
jgi:rsbT co-antagonist protein RsbR